MQKSRTSISGRFDAVPHEVAERFAEIDPDGAAAELEGLEHRPPTAKERVEKDAARPAGGLHGQKVHRTAAFQPYVEGVNDLLIRSKPETTSAIEYARIVADTRAEFQSVPEGVSVVFKNRPQAGTRTVERRGDGTLVFRIDTGRPRDEVADDVAAALRYARGKVGSNA